MRRREFITFVGSAAAWPMTARAQQVVMPVIGFLSSRSSDQSAHLVAAFRKGLNEFGYVESQNVAIEYRWARGQYESLPALASDLVSRRVDVIVASGGIPSALAAKTATTSIPIVFTSVDDPIAAGLVASLNRPGGNATGFSLFTNVLTAKQLELLSDLVSSVGSFGVLINPNNPTVESHLREAQDAARTFGLKLEVVKAVAAPDLDTAFTQLVQKEVRALLVANDPLFNIQIGQIARLAIRHKMPAISQFREFAVAGGLMGYGTNLAEIYRATGNYAGKVLKGINPTDLPVVQPTKFELVINLKTAHSLGLTVPPTLLARADEVIE